jgi:hypothetical protein
MDEKVMGRSGRMWRRFILWGIEEWWSGGGKSSCRIAIVTGESERRKGV